jgi:S-adenosylmethionine synthetase
MPLYPKDMFFTSESVTEGQPDKLCDQIADAVVDECLRRDPASRVSCEAFVTPGTVIVGGEMATSAAPNVDQITRDVAVRAGYATAAWGFDVQAVTVARAIRHVPPDARTAAGRPGAAPGTGGQAVVFGYACNQTPELMPLPILLAHRLAMRLDEVRRKEILTYLGPDGKTQVTVEYRDGKAVRAARVIVATQHAREAQGRDGQLADDARQEILARVVLPVLGPLADRRTKVTVNGTGRGGLAGGPMADTGITGRKTVVDTYGGWAPNGAGALSGKDPASVERGAAYMSRAVAKNVVAAGLADECVVQLAYGAGEADPVSVLITSCGTGTLTDEALSKLVLQVFALSPRGIVDALRLREPIYQRTAAYGHFGRTDVDMPWERTDMADELLAQLMKK